jgi:hypothetical protein
VSQLKILSVVAVETGRVTTNLNNLSTIGYMEFVPSLKKSFLSYQQEMTVYLAMECCTYQVENVEVDTIIGPFLISKISKLLFFYQGAYL